MPKQKELNNSKEKSRKGGKLISDKTRIKRLTYTNELINSILYPELVNTCEVLEKLADKYLNLHVSLKLKDVCSNLKEQKPFLMHQLDKKFQEAIQFLIPREPEHSSKLQTILKLIFIQENLLNELYLLQDKVEELNKSKN